MNNTTTVIGHKTRIEGNLVAEESVEVFGVTKSVSSKGSVTIHPNSNVEGVVEAEGDVTIHGTCVHTGSVSGTNVVISGTNDGEVKAKKSVTFEAGSQQNGKIDAPEVNIAKGSNVIGDIRTSRFLPAPGARFKGQIELVPEDESVTPTV